MTHEKFINMLEEYAELYEESKSISRGDDYADLSIRNQDRVFNRMRSIEDEIWRMLDPEEKF